MFWNHTKIKFASPLPANTAECSLSSPRRACLRTPSPCQTPSQLSPARPNSNLPYPALAHSTPPYTLTPTPLPSRNGKSKPYADHPNVPRSATGPAHMSMGGASGPGVFLAALSGVMVQGLLCGRLRWRAQHYGAKSKGDEDGR
jgi:hypothetical protein